MIYLTKSEGGSWFVGGPDMWEGDGPEYVIFSGLWPRIRVTFSRRLSPDRAMSRITYRPGTTWLANFPWRKLGVPEDVYFVSADTRPRCRADGQGFLFNLDDLAPAEEADIPLEVELEAAQLVARFYRLCELHPALPSHVHARLVLDDDFYDAE